MENKKAEKTLPGTAQRLQIAPLEEDLAVQKPKKRLRAGDLCPQCGQGRLDYDGLLNLACPLCGYALGGCFT